MWEATGMSELTFRSPNYRPEKEVQFQPYLQQYENPMLERYVEKYYSKLSAVDVVYDKIQDQERKSSESELERVVAALLTDRHLLFPQERECGNDDSLESRQRSRILHDSESKYEPKIRCSLCRPWKEQVEAYREFSFASYQKLQPMLEMFLHPLEGDRAKRFDKRPKERGYDEEGFYSALSDTFMSYWHKRKRKDLPERDEGNIEKAAAYFASTYQNEVSYYIDRPDVIFHLIRAPQLSVFLKRRSAPKKYILKAMEVPLSITTIEQDELLFRSLVAACAQECQRVKIPFPEEEWGELWSALIEPGIRSMSFRKEELLTYGTAFKTLLGRSQEAQERRKEFSDWLDEKLNGKRTAFFEAIYKTRVNTGNKPDRKTERDRKTKKKLEVKFQAIEKRYKPLFVSPKTSQSAETKYEQLNAFCELFRWNQGSIVLEKDGISDALYKKIEAADRYPSKENGKETKENWADLYRLFSEWLMVQKFSHEATMKLLDCVNILLKRMQTETT